MTTQPANLLVALVALLNADPGVAALLSDDTAVYGTRIPDDKVELMPANCVLVKPAGGSLHIGDIEIAWRRFDVLAYGKSSLDSESLHLAVREALRTLERYGADGFVIHEAHCEMDGVGGDDPLTGWPVTLASYRVLAALTATA